MSTRVDVIAAVATPPGRGGIGVVRVSGPDVSHIVAGLIGRALTPRVATLATFRAANGEALDQGIAILFAGPASYTGESVLELHAHGGPAVLALILERCLDLPIPANSRYAHFSMGSSISRRPKGSRT